MAIRWLTANVNATGSGDQAIVAAQAGKKIVLHGWALTIDGAINLKWRSNTTDKTGLFKFASAGLWESAPMQTFETAVGEALNLNFSGAGVIAGGNVFYTVE